MLLVGLWEMPGYEVLKVYLRLHLSEGIQVHGTYQYGNKESKPKDACITVTKDAKYFCPIGFDEGIFNAVTKLLHEKVEQAKMSGSDNAKTINAIECDSFCNFFKIPEQSYDAAFTQVIGESTPEILGKETN